MQAGDVAPHVDARSNLKAGLMDAGEASFGLKVDAKAVSPPGFLGQTNSDLAFVGKYAIQGNYNGPVIWDMTDPSHPALVTAYQCPASRRTTSVYKNLMFMSAEAFNGSRLQAERAVQPRGLGEQGSHARRARVRHQRHQEPEARRQRSDMPRPHTHTPVEDLDDKDNVYIYVSGSATIRSGSELPGCVGRTPDKDAVVADANRDHQGAGGAPEQSAVVNRANIFSEPKAAPTHGQSDADKSAQRRAVDSVRAHGNGIA
jgi:hypothetical protein